jgi:hypothetical protein
LIAIDAVAALVLLPDLDAHTRGQTMGLIPAALFRLVVWSAYFAKSRRAKVTFVH